MQLLLAPLRRSAALTPLAKSLTTRTLTTFRPSVRAILAPRRAFPAAASKRAFTTDPAITARPSKSEAYRKLAVGGALFGGTLVAINILFNSEGRVNPIPAFERQYLKETFTYTGVGIGIIGLAAKSLHNFGWSYRLMAMNPWVVLGGGLVASVGTMMGTLYTDPENWAQKHALWVGFNLTQALVLAPLFFYNPAVLARAGLYTIGIMGSISYVAATAKEDKYLYLGGPLLAGVAVVALSGLAPMVLPLGSRALMGAEAISLYGGLAVFGGFTLYDVQKVLNHARAAERGVMKKDTVNESVRLELDFINIFVRLVQILGGQQRKK
ncbi:inhibitor of apoptosis-promoting Bax1-domain-containing protein [Tricharina praecox]|uniref:inhibitor of apoptosis-promoting Bax1-domain-containing protein n=1 Tax=Tricharina praecox TaxID=43433 RepID=UPI0022206305|nr:inhibitor of apoptosis-promoting Bax1-domain-containing protein [Tricharina praecox]KAI5842764.1 inhibitor of apoptosis-promoting Bax1-domain-containing protein [Tricharina praecox]